MCLLLLTCLLDFLFLFFEWNRKLKWVSWACVTVSDTVETTEVTFTRCAYLAVGKLVGISFRLTWIFFDILLVQTLISSIFFIRAANFAWLGELLTKFPWIDAPIRQNQSKINQIKKINRKSIKIQSKINRKFERRYFEENKARTSSKFSLNYFCTVLCKKHGKV